MLPSLLPSVMPRPAGEDGSEDVARDEGTAPQNTTSGARFSYAVSVDVPTGVSSNRGCSAAHEARSRSRSADGELGSAV
jgi:hypothetical protein